MYEYLTAYKSTLDDKQLLKYNTLKGIIPEECNNHSDSQTKTTNQMPKDAGSGPVTRIMNFQSCPHYLVSGTHNQKTL
jgi:hypothetical protein